MHRSPERGNWIQTYTGKRFYPLDIQPEDIDILDIAHALSLTNRFTGHTRVAYSVAEHSVRVAHLAPFDRPDLGLDGLLHDASEAYLADVARPIKHLDLMAPYRELERTVQAAIYRKFGLPDRCSATTTESDNVLLATEGRDLMPTGTSDWTLYAAPHPTRIEPWSADLAMHQFLTLFLRFSNALQGAVRTRWDELEVAGA